MKSLIRYFVGMLIVLITTTIMVPGWLDVTYPKSTVPVFDSKVRTSIVDDLETRQPEIVLMGNSSLADGVDWKKFAELSSTSTYTIINQGSGTALWYLILKNNIAVSSYKPATIVMFFTDTLLTDPEDWVTGEYFSIIDEYASSLDELLINVSYRNQQTLLENTLIRWLPLYGYREGILRSIKDFVEYSLNSALLGCPAACMIDNTEDVFRSDHLLPDSLRNPPVNPSVSPYSWKTIHFNARVSRSFLPEMIHICKNNGIELVMVRMGTRQFLSQADEPLWVRGYFRALHAYLETQGVGYLDLAHDPRIHLEHYFDFDHMNKNGRQIFTQILAESLGPLLK
jgi:hypothetical protein